MIAKFTVEFWAAIPETLDDVEALGLAENAVRSALHGAELRRIAIQHDSVRLTAEVTRTAPRPERYIIDREAMRALVGGIADKFQTLIALDESFYALLEVMQELGLVQSEHVKDIIERAAQRSVTTVSVPL